MYAKNYINKGTLSPRIAPLPISMGIGNSTSVPTELCILDTIIFINVIKPRHTSAGIYVILRVFKTKIIVKSRSIYRGLKIPFNFLHGSDCTHKL